MSRAANDDMPIDIATEILDGMTPAERAEAHREARAKGVSLDQLVLSAAGVLAGRSDRDAKAFLRARGVGLPGKRG